MSIFREHECIIDNRGEYDNEPIGIVIPANDTVRQLSEFYKVFGDESRLRILFVISYAKEICVCEIAAKLKMSSSAISHQLKTLRDARLIKYRKSGKMVYYSLDDDHIASIIDQGIEHISEISVKVEVK